MVSSLGKNNNCTLGMGSPYYSVQKQRFVLFCFREDGTGEKKGERGQSLLSRPFFDTGRLSKKAAVHNPCQVHLRTWP